MNKFKQLFKRNIYFFVTCIILAISIIFAGVTLIFFGLGTAADQTRVGFIYLGNQDIDQYSVVLSREIDNWKDQADYQIQFQDYVYVIDMDYFDFDLNQTINQINDDQDNLAYFSISAANVLLLESDLETQFSPIIIDAFNLDGFIEDLRFDIQNLKNRKIYALSDYLVETIRHTELSQTTITLIDPTHVDDIVGTVSSISILGNQRFSLLSFLEGTELSNEQLSIIASGMQGVTHETHFNGFVFEQYYTKPIWASSGQNVRILRVNEFDFTFFNDFDSNYQVTIEKIDAQTLSFKLYGYPHITTYAVDAVNQIMIPFQTIYIDNPLIDAFTPGVSIEETDTEYIYTLLVEPGVPGYVIFFIRSSTRIGATAVSNKIFDEQVLPIPAIYYEHIVAKEGG